MPLTTESRPDRAENSLSKAVTLLRFVGAATDGVTFTQLRTASSQPKATLHRILQNLVDLQLLRIDADDRRYRLGYGLLELAGLAWSQLDVRRAGRQILLELNARTDESVHMAVLDGADIVYIDKVESAQPLRLASAIGLRNPAYCTGVGKALLAFLPAEELTEIIARTRFVAFTPNTLASEASLRAQLELIRQRGFAIDDEEHHLGIRCAAAPIFDHRGRPIASISVTAPSMRCGEARMLELQQLTVAAATRITHNCGGMHPNAGFPAAAGPEAQAR